MNNNDYKKLLDTSFENDSNILNQITNIYNFNNEQKNECEQKNHVLKYDMGIQTVKKYEEIDNDSENCLMDYNFIINFKNTQRKNDKNSIESITNSYEEEKNDEDQDKESKFQNNSSINSNNINSTNNSIIINKIFNITKKSKKSNLGRKCKREESKGKHTKFSLDNLIRRIKVRFINSSLNYINSQFINKDSILLKIIGTQGKEINRNKNLLWLNKKMKDIFYEDISKKTFNGNRNFNRELIDKIYRENQETKVIELLNYTVNDFYKLLYCSKTKIKGMNQLDDVIKELKNEGESIAYLTKFRDVSKELENIFINFKSRDRNK